MRVRGETAAVALYLLAASSGGGPFLLDILQAIREAFVRKPDLALIPMGV